MERIAIIPTSNYDSVNYFYKNAYFEKYPPKQLLKLIRPDNNNEFYIANFYLDRNIHGVIVDLGKHIGNEFEISWIEIQNENLHRTYKGKDILKYFQFNQFCDVTLKGNDLHIKTKAMEKMFIPRFYNKDILISRYTEIFLVIRSIAKIVIGFILLLIFNKYYFRLKTKTLSLTTI